MKRLPKVPTVVIIVFVLAVCSIAAIDLILLPFLIRTKGAAFLEQKSKGCIQAESVQYVPFRGIRLKELTFLSQTKKPLFSIDRVYVKAKLLSLIFQRHIGFRAAAYPAGMKNPVVLDGFYRIRQKKLDLGIKMRSDLFARPQVISAKAEVFINQKDKSTMRLDLSSPDAQVSLSCFLKENYFFIEKLSAEVIDSQFELVGDMQDTIKPALNVYGTFTFNPAGLKKINPKYTGPLAKLNIQGRLPGDIFIGSQPQGIEAGIKIRSGQARIEQIDIEDVAVALKLQNNKATLTKLYGKLCGGELNLEGSCNLDSPGLITNLNLNLFNLEMEQLIGNITGKPSPVHGRLFCLAQVYGSLKNPQGAEGKAWVNAAGSNILRLPVFAGMGGVLRIPQLAGFEFKEAGGNFTIAGQKIQTDDFKISGQKLTMYFKGYMDFAGNLNFDIRPEASENLTSESSDFEKIMGIFMDATGNYLGEMKLEGTIQKPEYTFKPVSMEKIIPRGIEEGLRYLFKRKGKD